MAANPEYEWNGAPGHRIVIAVSALPALDGLSATERAAVGAALADLEQATGSLTVMSRLQRLDVPGEPDLYVLRPTEQLRLVLRLTSDGTGEVLAIVRPETLRRLFATATAERA